MYSSDAGEHTHSAAPDSYTIRPSPHYNGFFRSVLGTELLIHLHTESRRHRTRPIDYNISVSIRRTVRHFDGKYNIACRVLFSVKTTELPNGRVGLALDIYPAGIITWDKLGSDLRGGHHSKVLALSSHTPALYSSWCKGYNANQPRPFYVDHEPDSLSGLMNGPIIGLCRAPLVTPWSKLPKIHIRLVWHNKCWPLNQTKAWDLRPQLWDLLCIM